MKNSDSLGDIVKSLKKLNKNGVAKENIEEIAENYGEKGLKAARHGDDAVKAILKYGDNAADLINTYGKNAAKTIADYGDNAVKAITKNGDDAINLITKHGDNAAKAIADRGNNAIIVISSPKNGKKAAEVIANSSDKLFERIINSQGYADDIVEHVTTYGVSAEKVIIEHSDDAVRALNNGITPKTINDLQKIGIEPSNYGRNRAIYSEERAQSIISLNKHIHAEFTDEEISVLKKKVIDYEQQLKSEGIKQNEIGPAVCGVYNKRSNK